MGKHKADHLFYYEKDFKTNFDETKIQMWAKEGIPQ
jgi:hypothetical protein